MKCYGLSFWFGKNKNLLRIENLDCFLGLAAVGLVGFAVYKYRIRRYMDSEIRAIMAQYMPLDGQGEIPTHYAAPRGDI